MEHLIGKEVQIYPGDANKKRGNILKVYDHGILFEITYYSGTDGQWVVGKQHYVAFSARLSFREI